MGRHRRACGFNEPSFRVVVFLPPKAPAEEKKYFSRLIASLHLTKNHVFLLSSIARVALDSRESQVAPEK